jgi:hypothetical protein
MTFLDLFTKVTEVEGDIHHLEIKEVFKENGNIVVNERIETYNLIPYESFDNDLINHLIKNCNSKEIKFPKNLIQKLYKKNELKKLDLSTKTVISNKKNLSNINSKSKVEFNIDKIICFGNCELLINKNNKLFYTNHLDFEVYTLK